MRRRETGDRLLAAGTRCKELRELIGFYGSWRYGNREFVVKKESVVGREKITRVPEG